jgi:hypothetical protein
MMSLAAAIKPRNLLACSCVDNSAEAILDFPILVEATTPHYMAYKQQNGQIPESQVYKATESVQKGSVRLGKAC